MQKGRGRGNISRRKGKEGSMESENAERVSDVAEDVAVAEAVAENMP